MAAGPVAALATASLVAVAAPAQRQGGALATTLLAFGWALSPAVAWLLSRPARREVSSLSTDDRRRLRMVARRTWLYFERFVGPEDQWLPPDHFQESPRGAVAHRTSPTNIGLMLSSTLAAYDMGFLGVRSLLGRVTASLASMRQLETHRGHLLNWYDTKTLQPLAPRYVSTVDSGNFLAGLVALAGGCAELERRSVNRFATFEGAVTMLDLYREAAANLPTDVSALTDYLDATTSRLLATRAAPATWWTTLKELEDERLPALDEFLLAAVKAAGTGSDHEHLAEIALWSGRLHRLVQESTRDIVAFMPWLDAAHVRLAARFADLPDAPTFAELPTLYDAVEHRLHAAASSGPGTHDDLDALRIDLDAARALHASLSTDAAAIIDAVDGHLEETDFEFLYDDSRHVFSIGYDVDNARLDSHAYDLFASEARLASFIAIAWGRVPVTHWLHLSRPYALAGGDTVMLSWSGTMFEYLTPSLFLPTPRGSVTDTALRAVVERQIAFGALKGVPWGVSESGYALTDAQLNYQYYAFGVPDLALARVSDDDLVIAPYAALMALRVDPQRTLANLDDLTELGAMGLYGFYEALDFTPSRAGPAGRPSIVRSFMAHHHGMTLVTIGNLLFDDVFVERFRHDVRVRSVEYLLHEGVPATVKLEDLAGRRDPAAPTPVESVPDVAWDVQPHQRRVQANAVSNATTTVVTTTAGAGFTRWNGLDVTRWRSDPTTDEWGEWLYLQDLEDADATPWSATRAPTGVTGSAERVTFQPHATTIGRTVAGILCRTTVSVAQEDDVVIRTIALTNTGDAPRRLALTSYGEVVLAEHAADVRHPAFGNLFVESSFDPDRAALLFRRRPRSAEEKPVHLLHGMVNLDPSEHDVEYDANRRSVIGRRGSARRPAGLARDRFAADIGSTLDPVYALRTRVTLQPHATARLAVISVMGRSRREVIATADRYRSLRELDRAVDEARVARSRRLLRSGIDPADVPTLLGLLSHLLYPSRDARAAADVLRANRRGQSGLWAHGISGDHPLLLVRVAGPADLDDVKLALSGHALWRDQGFTVDVVILNQGDDGYRQSTHDALRSLVNRSGNDAWLDRTGGIFLLSAQRMQPDEVTQLEAVARVVMGAGSEARFAPASTAAESVLPTFTPPNPELLDEYRDAGLQRPTDLEFDNGYGGFADEGREYVVFTDPDDPSSTTPAPWVNVIANPGFGTMVTEIGSSTTWAVNSSENRLTPWSNDAVRDPTGEALYLRDEETGAVWTPTPAPRPGPSTYLTRHRAGSTTFEHRSHALDQELTVFVPPDAPVKVVRLTLGNRSSRQRRVTATYYARLLLGTGPEATSHHLVIDYDAANGALLARNAFTEGFGEQVAFLAGSHPVHGFTTDREEFIGREGSLEDPAALRRIGLSGQLEPGGDPCAALQFHVDLAAGGRAELFFVLGRAQDRAHAEDLVRTWRDADTVEAAARRTALAWDDLLGAVQITTPDRSFDVLLNRWLLYQAVSCRLWGRTAFYQSSGAFGFRDQLQDALALVHVRPADLRSQLVRAAAHQFKAGDVLHWWHPPGGQGVRTRFSDDLVWLPYATAHYLDATDDDSVLDEVVPFLSGPELAQGVAENYDRFSAGEQSGTVYEHCVRALERACTSGPHGLPLIGSGDWNDGMSRVGIGGRGESVWLAWFLIRTLRDFAVVCARRDDHEKAAEYDRRAEAYRGAVEASAWDGEWYVRAFYDDGTPLGSHLSDEPKIDAIAQAWAVLSAAAEPRRAEQAMRSAQERLVDEEERLVLLLAPPFDRGKKDPGYIKGYPPGVRENGGQYTHAATWTLWALADLGHGADATDLYSLISPVNLSADRGTADGYRVEPYVIAADVYGHPPHTGMGGWTWYTGSASWYYRLGLERLLGVTRHGDTLRIDPRFPADWPGYTVAYRFGASLYRIAVTLPHGVEGPTGPVDVQLVDDGEVHDITITLRTAAPAG